MKKRIALVINTLSGGGAERTVSNLSMALSERYDIDIVVNDTEHITYPYSGRILSLRMPAWLKPASAVYQMTALVRRIRVLRRLKKSGAYTAMLSFSGLTNLANALSGKQYAKTIVSVRNSVSGRKDREPKQRLFLRFVLPYICRKASLTVSCSKEIAEELMTECGLSEDKSAVIYNGLQLERIQELAAAPLPAFTGEDFPPGKLLLTVGRLTDQKGQWHLLPVLKHLREEGMPVCLVILGEGELRPMLEERIARLGLSGCVMMPGFVENPYPYLARADAVLMPSLYEGFSNAIIEAMACGAPVVATDHKTGAREILAPETDYRIKISDGVEMAAFGILVPVCGSGPEEFGEALLREEGCMAEAIRMLLTDDKLMQRYREASFMRADQLAIARICEQWIKVIESG